MEISEATLQGLLEQTVRTMRAELRSELETAGIRERITITDLVAKARRTVRSSSQGAYGAAWKALVDGIARPAADPAAPVADRYVIAPMGSRWADDIQTSELVALVDAMQARALERHAAQDRARFEAGRVTRNHEGKSARRSAVTSLRKLFDIAVNDGHCARNPALKLDAGKKPRSRREGFSPERVPELLAVAQTTGDDPDLDVIVLKFHLITGARQEGALNLRLRHLDLRACEVVLDEKNGDVQRQPVPDWFMTELHGFALSRGAVDPDDHVLRKRLRTGRFEDITARRYNYIFERLQAQLAWADQLQVSAHTLRHCAATYVERVAGRAVSHRFLRHTEDDVTGNYVKASAQEVAAAVVAIWGGTHPSLPTA